MLNIVEEPYFRFSQNNSTTNFFCENRNIDYHSIVRRFIILFLKYQTYKLSCNTRRTELMEQARESSGLTNYSKKVDIFFQNTNKIPSDFCDSFQHLTTCILTASYVHLT
jgi:hypothetical protein